MALTPRQTEIVEAAIDLVADGGIQKLTTKNLAAALAVSEPALYRHFKSKSEIVRTMISRFDEGVKLPEALHGFNAVEAYAEARFRQVAARPALAKILFAEELFLSDSDCSALLLKMMHLHKTQLAKAFQEAVARGEIRGGLDEATLFRLVFGPVRLLVRQFGMSGAKFDLIAEGKQLLEVLRTVLK